MALPRYLPLEATVGYSRTLYAHDDDPYEQDRLNDDGCTCGLDRCECEPTPEE